MAKCPACGKEVAAPTKTWVMENKKNPKAPKLKTNLFQCSCGKKFRVVEKVA